MVRSQRSPKNWLLDLPPLDIYTSANELIKQHGEYAPIHAAMRHDELLEAGPRAADLVVPMVGGYLEPLLAVYRHRCLASIHSALISGEYKMNGWWGQIRVFTMPGS